MQELEGRKVLVTGAGKSLGRIIAIHLAGLGADIAVNYNSSRDGAKKVCAENSKLGRNSIPIQADISNPKDVRKMYQEINSKLGTIDILVNNAAINIDSTIKKMDDDTWDKVLSVSLTGTFNCAREAISGMRESGWGRIINVSSVVGFVGAFGAANYAAAKAAIIGFTKSLAREVARYEITANAVSPGYFDIGMGTRLPEDFRTDLLKLIPLGRFGRPEEMTAAIAFLASKDASYITGQVLHVNGGYYM
ncbi:MAG: 3-oxoacyl-ACP reductase family protein [Candidatus Thorarchaeota archaeon]